MFGRVLTVCFFLATVRTSKPEETPEITLSSFEDFLKNEGVFYPRSEMKLRMGLYRESAAYARLHNSRPQRTFDMGLNQFSTMTEAEKQQYLGVSVNQTEWQTESEAHYQPEEGEGLKNSKKVGIPSSVDHVETGIITGAKNQGGCGSCWAFAATASFEGVYGARTWKVKDFADQEILDCSYSDTTYNGCNGGWMNKGWEYLQRNGHFSLRNDIGYTAKDRPCDYSSKPNNIQNVKVQDWTRVLPTDDHLALAISVSVPAVAITVENDFYGYKSGIYNGCPDVKTIHHAVTAVGYDAHSWKIKNSWGSGWGEGGYIRMARSKPSICRISEFAMYPNVDFMDGVVTIKNDQTGRYLSTHYLSEDIRDKRGYADGWSYGNTYVYATDANYYNDALWKFVDLGDNTFFIEHFHTGRWLHSDGSVIRNKRGGEGGWLSAPHIRATDHNYYGLAVWRKVNLGGGKYYIEHNHSGRYLLASGSNIKGKPISQQYGNEKVFGSDANYYHLAVWRIEPLSEEDRNRLI